jgi:SAM-dependent methyltransferase
MQEAKRVLKPGGKLLIFEHNPYNPLTLYIVKTCPLDENAVLLNDRTLKHLYRDSGFSDIKQEFIIFFPIDKPLFRYLENYLKFLPLGAQYVVHAQKD